MKKSIAPGASVGVGGAGNHVLVGIAVNVPTISVLTIEMEVSITSVDWIAGVDREGLQDAIMTIRNSGRIALMIFMVWLPYVGTFNPWGRGAISETLTPTSLFQSSPGSYQ